MPLVTQKVNLKDSFQYTNLDLEDSGPTSVSSYGHQQNFTPTDAFTDSSEGSKTGGKLKDDGFSGPENLDIESNPKTFFKKSPSGKQKVGFTQQWGPNANEYQGADLGEKGIGLFNENNSLAGNLDIENNPPTPASTGKNGGTFVQKYSPNGQFINSPEGDVTSEKLENKLNTSTSNNTGLANQNTPTSLATDGVQRSFVSSSLDLENSSPNGGPNHAPLNGHTQVYTPKNTYLDSPEGQLRSNDSPAERNNFTTSALDIERTSAGVRQGGKGGPTNISYTTKIGSETKTFNTTNPYTPHVTYTNQWQTRGDIDVSRLRDSYK